jgi:hypothetical protein
MKMRSILFLAGCWLFIMGAALPLQGQMNLKIGYSIGLMDPVSTNKVMRDYNETRDFDNTMDDLNLLSGVTIGIRNRWDLVGLEFSWSSKINRRQADGVFDDKNFFQALFFRYGAFSAGLEFHGGNFAIGGSIDATDFIIRTEVTGEKDAFEVVNNQFTMANTFYVHYEIKANDVMGIAFRPYIQIPWSTLNVYDLHTELLPTVPALEEDFNENMLNFGLIFIFYNGQQSR